jgi:hypothetical protein
MHSHTPLDAAFLPVAVVANLIRIVYTGAFA